MSAYEVMLSESQERMLLIVRPEGIDRVREVVERWSLRATPIGRVTDDGRVRVRDGDAVVADVPAALFTDACPTYEPAAAENPAAAQRRVLALETIPDVGEDPDPGSGSGSGSGSELLLRLLAEPNVGSRRPVYERYDQTILTNTVVPPGFGDAAVLRLKGTGRGIALAIDCNSRYCSLDPELGARHAVAEATRNVSVAGGRPLAVTNCLNFGNPEKPGGAYQLRQAVAGMAAACRALGVPVVSGNVSLYNETGDRAVMPTPIVGVVGVLDDVRRHATIAWRDGDEVLLVGGGPPTLGASEYLAAIHGQSRGRPPALDLGLEGRVQALVRDAIADGGVTCAHDCSLGGLAVTLAEMAVAAGVGLAATSVPAVPSGRADEALFGEAPSRVVVALPPSAAERLRRRCARDDVPVVSLGRAGGDRIVIGRTIDVDLDQAGAAFASALAASRLERGA
jgi:phosphoribosylformylglycinamidine synthase